MSKFLTRYLHNSRELDTMTHIIIVIYLYIRERERESIFIVLSKENMLQIQLVTYCTFIQLNFAIQYPSIEQSLRYYQSNSLWCIGILYCKSFSFIKNVRFSLIKF